jgi:hypothetical protein
MSLLDDLARGVKSVADSASSEMSLYTLRGQLRESEQAIWQIYSQMGYRALELLNQGAVTDAKLSDLSRQLGPHLGRIEQLKREIEATERKTARQTPGEAASSEAAPLPTPSPTSSPSSTPSDPPSSSGVYDVE